jgi:hypothetical protein
VCNLLGCNKYFARGELLPKYMTLQHRIRIISYSSSPVRESYTIVRFELVTAVVTKSISSAI